MNESTPAIGNVYRHPRYPVMVVVATTDDRVRFAVAKMRLTLFGKGTDFVSTYVQKALPLSDDYVFVRQVTNPLEVLPFSADLVMDVIDEG